MNPHDSRVLCRVAVLAGLVLASAQSARGQVSRDTVALVSPIELGGIVDTLVARLRTVYLDTGVGRRMAEMVRRRYVAGEYAGLIFPRVLADSLSTHLRRQSGDEHVRVRYRPYGTTAPSVVGDTAGRAERRERYLRDARWENFGFDAVRVFPGSVGYLELHEFAAPSFAGPTLAAAMEFLRHSRAVIIDLRRNGGGYESLIQLMMAYFLPQPTLLWTTFDRLKDRRAEAWSGSYAPGGFIEPEVGVYVLTSARTFSAAEMFAAVMQGSRRGTIVGERTRGGGNFGDFLRMNSRFDAFIPYGTTDIAFTGRSLERVGVLPDIAVSADSALTVARVHALRRIRASLSEQELIDEVDDALQQLERTGR